MKYQSYPFQERAKAWVIDLFRCALYLGMGLGKTVVVLNAIRDLLACADIRRVLVVAPLRVAHHTWPAEIEKWDHLDLTYQVIKGTRTERILQLKTEVDIHIVNYELLATRQSTNYRTGRTSTYPGLVDLWGSRWPYDMVVLDESSRLKNPGAQCTRALRRAVMQSQVNRVVELTGTPAPNGLLDLWSQIYMLDAGARLGHTLSAFRQRWFSCLHLPTHDEVDTPAPCPARDTRQAAGRCTVDAV